ncbi:MAG: ATP-binding protein [Pseudomonadota bacterium]
MTKRTFPAQLRNLPEAMAFLSACAASQGMSPDRVGEIELVVEEVLVNIINYAYPGGDGDVTVHCDTDDAGQVVMTFIDSGAAFDPLSLPAPDIGADIDSRTVGGLGVFFVRELSEDVTYARRGETNQLTITFGKREA